MTRRRFVPSTGLKDVIFWSTIAFAFGGVESASTMGEEIQDARRTVPRAILAAGAVITVLYIARHAERPARDSEGTGLGLQGIMQAIQAMTARVGVAWLAPIVAALVTLNALGGVGGWFAATARLPFVAGIDRFLPPAFGRLHPTWRTPYVALLVQAAIAGLFVFLGQAGTSVRGAYDALVSMGIIAYFIPFLFMFAAMIVLQREPAGPDVMRVPGGRRSRLRWRRSASSSPPCRSSWRACRADEEPNKTLAVVKVVGSSVALVGDRRGGVLHGQATGAVDEAGHVARDRAVVLIDADRRHGRRRAADTMRVDYYHTGNAKEERFSLDRVVIEPLPWPGNPARPIDDTNRGKYFFEVVDAASGARALLARLQLDLRRMGDDRRGAEDRPDVLGVAALSGAGRAGSRSSSRSAMRGMCFATSGRWRSIRPTSSCCATRRRPTPGPLIKLHESGDPATKLDLLILGDGYTARGARQVRARRAPARRDVCSRRRRSRSGRATSTSGDSCRRRRSPASRGRRRASTAGRRSAPPTTRSTPSATC